MFCVFEGFLEVIVRHADHGDVANRVPNPKNPAGFGSDPDPVAGSTLPDKNPPGTRGSKRTGGTPTSQGSQDGYSSGG